MTKEEACHHCAHQHDEESCASCYAGSEFYPINNRTFKVGYESCISQIGQIIQCNNHKSIDPPIGSCRSVAASAEYKTCKNCLGRTVCDNSCNDPVLSDINDYNRMVDYFDEE